VKKSVSMYDIPFIMKVALAGGVLKANKEETKAS